MAIIIQKAVKHILIIPSGGNQRKIYEVLTTFMQNEPNFQKSQMKVNLYNTTDYENKSNWTLGENEPNTNPIRTQSKPIKTNQSQFQTQYKPNSNPIKANVGSLGNLFDHIEIFVFKTKLKILILRDRLDILLINEALRLIR